MNKKIMNKKINDFGLFLQALLVSVMSLLFMVSLFVKEFDILARIALGCVLLVMSHNNETTYHKRYLTVLYALVGIFVIVATILGV